MVYFWTKHCFVGAIPDRLMTRDCCEDACVEIKCFLSINYGISRRKTWIIYIKVKVE